MFNFRYPLVYRPVNAQSGLFKELILVKYVINYITVAFVLLQS